MKPTFPDAILRNHTAILGKTGSGKTITGKLLVEQAAAQGARVCVLDPIKSDWWGLTSSASGKSAGLAFRILGGPRGHVPLHAASGKVIGELVGTGKLPLTILDMADFEPGDHQRFFVDFAKTLFKRIKGVVYLVLEEAHEFAPKERAGFGAESMAIHWAKRLATGSRSKGIRLIILSQRTQALHNALLGSCETAIVHRLTLPADQAPVIKWLEGNVPKDVAEKVEAEMSSIPTGSGWVCAGEAKIFERRKLPMIRTFDNSATPDHDAADIDVKTAPIDQDELRGLIGAAVKEAEADDPRKLRAEIARLNAELAKKPAGDPDTITTAETRGETRAKADAAKAIKNLRAALEAAMKFIVQINADGFFKAGGGEADKAAIEKALLAAAEQATAHIERHLKERDKTLAGMQRQAEQITERIQKMLSDDTLSVAVNVQHNEPFTVTPSAAPRPPRELSQGNGDDSVRIGKGERAVLAVVAQYPDGVTREQLTVLTGYKRSSRDAYIARLKAAGCVQDQGGYVMPTQNGITTLGPDYQPLPTGDELRRYWLDRLPEGEKAILSILIQQHPQMLPRTEFDTLTNYKRSSRDAYIARLSARMLVKTDRGSVGASDLLFG